MLRKYRVSSLILGSDDMEPFIVDSTSSAVAEITARTARHLSRLLRREQMQAPAFFAHMRDLDEWCKEFAAVAVDGSDTRQVIFTRMGASFIIDLLEVDATPRPAYDAWELEQRDPASPKLEWEFVADSAGGSVDFPFAEILRKMLDIRAKGNEVRLQWVKKSMGADE